MSQTDPPLFNPKTSVFIEDFPHIHIHTLGNKLDEELEDNEQGIAELCCHGCGESIFIIFSGKVVKKYNGIHPELVKIKEEFVDRHANCADQPIILNGASYDKFEFTIICPTHRTKTKTIDVTNS